MNTKARNTLTNIAASFFLFLFTYSGLHKLLDYERFEATLAQSPVLASWAAVLGVLVPIAELSVATLLFFPLTRRTGLWAAFGLLGFFALYVGSLLTVGGTLPCACNALINSLSWQEHFQLNLSLATLALGAALLYDLPGGTPLHHNQRFLRKKQEPAENPAAKE